MTSESRRGATPGILHTRGLALEVLDWGDVDSASTVVLGLHGFLDAAAFLGALAQELVRPGVAARLLTFAGHGRSERADVYRWFDHTRDVLALAADTGARNRTARLVLLGHSFGAVQALEAARWLDVEPAAVVNLDAVSGPGDGPAGRMPISRVLGGPPRRLPMYPTREVVLERRASFNPRVRQTQLADLSDEFAVRIDGGWTWRVDPALTGWVRPWQMGWTEAPEPVALMRELGVPTLLITGGANDHPQIRGPYPGDEVLGALPGVVHHRLPESGHYVHLECPARVAGLVGRFVGDLP